MRQKMPVIGLVVLLALTFSVGLAFAAHSSRQLAPDYHGGKTLFAPDYNGGKLPFASGYGLSRDVSPDPVSEGN
jgi:hypothetical protein